MPPKTDHYPVIQVLDIEHVVVKHVLTPLYRIADWSEYRSELSKALAGLEWRASYNSVKEVTDAIQMVERAVSETTRKVVKLSSLAFYVKHWFTHEMTLLRKQHAKPECLAYKRHLTPEHPVHAQARKAAEMYSKAVADGKAHHWVEWQEDLVDDQVWDVHRFLNATPSDGSAAHIPTLERCHSRVECDRGSGDHERGEVRMATE
jgi:hypothetical protein